MCENSHVQKRPNRFLGLFSCMSVFWIPLDLNRVDQKVWNFDNNLINYKMITNLKWTNARNCCILVLIKSHDSGSVLRIQSFLFRSGFENLNLDPYPIYVDITNEIWANKFWFAISYLIQTDPTGSGSTPLLRITTMESWNVGLMTISLDYSLKSQLSEPWA